MEFSIFFKQLNFHRKATKSAYNCTDNICVPFNLSTCFEFEMCESCVSSLTFSLQDNRIRSISAPLNCSEPKVEDHHDDRWSAPALMSASFSTQSHYDYPRKFSEPSVPAERKV